jgi:hypothetical protein
VGAFRTSSVLGGGEPPHRPKLGSSALRRIDRAGFALPSPRFDRRNNRPTRRIGAFGGAPLRADSDRLFLILSRQVDVYCFFALLLPYRVEYKGDQLGNVDDGCALHR